MELNESSPGEQKKLVTKTDGYWVEYSDGRRFIDLHCGNSAYILGYNDQDVLDSMRNYPVHFLRGNTGETSELNEQLINDVCTKGNWSSVAWAVSGSDAVEAAIAMNDHYWSILGQDKRKILSFSPGYHGTTMLGRHLRGDFDYLGRAICAPATSWKVQEDQANNEHKVLTVVEYYLKKHKDIGCIIMETIPWLNSVTPYSQHWWETIRRLCDEHDVLMIVDDVALCYGKNGHLFGYQKYGVQPDISSIGKSFTAGFSPLGAAVCTKRISEVLHTKPWTYSHTWSPNMQGVAAAVATTKKVESLLYRVPTITKELVSIGQELGLNYRGDGLLFCYDLPKDYSIADFVNHSRLSVTLRIPKCLMIIPPLIADDEYFDIVKSDLKKVLGR